MAVFFLIRGMLLIIFDVLVLIGIRVILVWRLRTPYFQAEKWKQPFRLHEPYMLRFSSKPPTNSFSQFSAIFSSQQRFKFPQELFRIWILKAWSPAPHEHILCHRGVQSGIVHALCISKPCELARYLSKTYTSVAWRMRGSPRERTVA